jgi:hypothetical protein
VRFPSGLESGTVEIKLLDQEVASGRGREVEDYTKKRIFQVSRFSYRPLPPGSPIGRLCSRGESMIDEKINDRFITIFHPGLTEENGIYVVFIGDALVVKRFDFDTSNQIIVWISANLGIFPAWNWKPSA